MTIIMNTMKSNSSRSSNSKSNNSDGWTKMTPKSNCPSGGDDNFDLGIDVEDDDDEENLEGRRGNFQSAAAAAGRSFLFVVSSVLLLQQLLMVVMMLLMLVETRKEVFVVGDGHSIDGNTGGGDVDVSRVVLESEQLEQQQGQQQAPENMESFFPLDKHLHVLHPFLRKHAASNDDDSVVDDDTKKNPHGDSTTTTTTTTTSNNVLNVHIVPHTHDDVGWRKTVEQYFYGWNNTIDTRGNVQGIIQTALESLVESNSRTFTYVEQKFFSMWWDGLSDDGNAGDAIKDSLRFLIANQQWSFVNGGWCMHDEAATHFMGMIDQTAVGHAFLLENLGYVPTVAWQLDPFGHSATQASLLTHKAGMNALYFGRIDYQDLQLRQLTQECEGLWKASSAPSSSSSNDTNDDDDVDDSTIFWGLTGSYEGNYGPPPGFCFDVLCSEKERLIGLNHTFLLERLQTFLEYVRIQSDRTKGDHIMLTFGTDFTYQNAQLYFANLDVLIGSIMMFQKWGLLDVSSIFGHGNYDRVNVFYSSPDYYTKMKYQELRQHRQNQKQEEQQEETPFEDQQQQKERRELSPLSSSSLWKVKTDDFFPYSDGPHNFWTGYFTSRTAFKRFERVASGFLLGARQIEAQFSSFQANHSRGGPLFELEDALGVVQHHDAVSGTAKQHVADDYSKRLQSGLDTAAEFVAKTLKSAMLGDQRSHLLDDMIYCHRLNESVCQVSEDATKWSGDTNRTNASVPMALYVVVYNPVASSVATVVRLPVSSHASYLVERVESRNIELKEGSKNKYNEEEEGTQLVESAPAWPREGGCCEKEKFVLAFDTGDLPAVGAATFRITKKNDFVASKKERARNAKLTPLAIKGERASDSVQVSSSSYTVHFDPSTGMIQRVVTADGTTDMNLTQTWGYYTSFDSSMDHTEINPYGTGTQNSGAYIFRPSTPDQELVPLRAAAGQAEFVNTSFGVEVHVSFKESWIKQVTRIYSNQPFIEVEYNIGPIPIDDGRGKEIVTRYSAPISNDATFYTDSNGREFFERRRNYRPSWPLDTYEPVAGNYYPVNAAIYIESKDSGATPAALAVAVDRSQGGASLMDGSLELMVQRRTVVDDGRGVDEPMNETCCGMRPYPPYGKAERIGHGIVVRGTHRLMVGSVKAGGGARLARSVMDRTFAQPMVLVGSSPENVTVTFEKPSFSALQASLPQNVMLITFAKLHSPYAVNTYVVRLGHQYGIDEDSELSKPAEIDLGNLFSEFKVSQVAEKTLSGNQNWDDFRRNQIKWTAAKDFDDLAAANRESTTNVVTLQPMDIKTFHVVVEPSTVATIATPLFYT